MTFLKANLPTIRINGKLFHKFDHSLNSDRIQWYRHSQTQQQVYVTHNLIYDWCIHGVRHYYVSVSCLSASIHMDEKRIGQYTTQAQRDFIDKFVGEALMVKK